MHLDELLKSADGTQRDTLVGDDVDGSQAQLGLGMHIEAFMRGNDVVQRHLAVERSAAGLLVSPHAREAIEDQVLPQLEVELAKSGNAEVLAKGAKEEIKQAFTDKSTTYTRLVSYKSIDQSDTQYLEDLLRVLDEWVVGTDSSTDDDADEVKVKIHVDSEVSVKVDKGTMTNVEVESSPKQAKLCLDLPEENFDLNEVRI